MSLQDPNRVNPTLPKRIAMVIANPATSTTSGWPVGFWWSELAHPWIVFDERGYEIEIFSPQGGKCVADALSDPRDPSGYSEHDVASLGFLSSPRHAALIESTRPVREITVAHFDAILVAGGQSPMFTFESATDLHGVFAAFFEARKVAACLCHGTAILRYARATDGKLIAAGRTITGFANVEEDFADNAVWQARMLARDKHVMPWRIEDEMKRIGANYVQAGLWKAFAVRDANLITGQQNFSGAATARLVVDALGG